MMPLATRDSPSYYFASFVVLLDTAYVNGKVLNMVDVAEARELRKTTSQRSLATFEAVALTATRTRLLTVQTTTSGLAGAQMRDRDLRACGCDENPLRASDP